MGAVRGALRFGGGSSAGTTGSAGALKRQPQPSQAEQKRASPSFLVSGSIPVPLHRWHLLGLTWAVLRAEWITGASSYTGASRAGVVAPAPAHFVLTAAILTILRASVNC